MTANVWVMGDPHGDFRRLTKIALARRPDVILVLGDLELPAPLEEVFHPLTHEGIVVRGVHGNHDADHEILWRRISDSPLAEVWNLHGRVENICGLRIAGMGGIFRSKVWYPPDEPAHKSYADFERKLIPWHWTPQRRAQKSDWSRSQLLTHRATIFPDVYRLLADQEADVLITHEAPGGEGGHPHGFQAIRDLAERLGAKTAWHGHHHESIRYAFNSKCSWTGVGKTEIVDLWGNRIE